MSGSDGEEENKLQMYTLVRFIHRGRRRQVESIDIVPSKWLDFDASKGRCVTKYLRPPYNEEDLQLIQALTMKNADAPEDWPVFSVELKGRAETYNEALKKINRLESEEHVLTLESGDNASEVQKQLELDVKRKKFIAEAKKLKIEIKGPSTDDDNSHCHQTKENTSDSKDVPVISQKRKLPLKKSWASRASEGLQQNNICTKTVMRNEEVDGTPFEDNENNFFDKALEPTTSNNGKVSDAVLMAKENDSTLFSSSNSKNNTSTVSIVGAQFCTLPSQPAATLEDISELDTNVFTVTEINPIHELVQINCKSDFESVVLTHLLEIKQKQEEMAKQIDSIKLKQESISNFLIDKKVVTKGLMDLGAKYNIALPISTYEDFTSFENLLQTNKYFKNDVYLELRSLIDKDFVVTKSIVKMLKKFLTKDLAIRFTAIRSSSINKNKEKFKPTQFCELIYGTIVKVRSEKSINTSSEDLDAALTDVFSNVPKWKI